LVFEGIDGLHASLILVQVLVAAEEHDWLESLS